MFLNTRGGEYKLPARHLSVAGRYGMVVPDIYGWIQPHNMDGGI
jgi:hypothetical protein